MACSRRSKNKCQRCQNSAWRGVQKLVCHIYEESCEPIFQCYHRARAKGASSPKKTTHLDSTLSNRRVTQACDVTVSRIAHGGVFRNLFATSWKDPSDLSSNAIMELELKRHPPRKNQLATTQRSQSTSHPSLRCDTRHGVPFPNTKSGTAASSNKTPSHSLTQHGRSLVYDGSQLHPLTMQKMGGITVEAQLVRPTNTLISRHTARHVCNTKEACQNCGHENISLAYQVYSSRPLKPHMNKKTVEVLLNTTVAVEL